MYLSQESKMNWNKKSIFEEMNAEILLFGPWWFKKIKKQN